MNAKKKTASANNIAPAKKTVSLKQAASAKKATAPKISNKSEPGFIQRADGIILPTQLAGAMVVAPNKLQAGLHAAQGQIKKTLQELAAIFTREFEVSEIELALSFNADGKFLGFGVGGEISVTVKIVPGHESDA